MLIIHCKHGLNEQEKREHFHMSVLSVQVINLNFHHKNLNTAPNTHHLYLFQQFEQTEDP